MVNLRRIFDDKVKIINLALRAIVNKSDESNNNLLKTGNPKGEMNNIPGSFHLMQFKKLTESMAGMTTAREQETLLFLSAYGNTSGDIIEIGSWVGKSTSFLAKGCSIRNEGIVYAIDHFKGRPGYEKVYYGGLGTKETIYDRFTKNIREVGLEAYIKVLKMYSEEAREKIAGNIRLLFIDGDHEYESLSRDIELFEELLNNGGIIALHDYNITFPGVLKAVTERIVDTGRFEQFVLVDSLFIATKKKWACAT